MMIDSFPPLDDRQACDAYRQLLDDIVAEEVDAASLASVELHLARCADCQFALAQARSYQRMMRRLGSRGRAPDSLRDRAAALAREPRGPQP